MENQNKIRGLIYTCNTVTKHASVNRKRSPLHGAKGVVGWLSRVPASIKPRHFLFYSSLENLSTTLLSYSCCFTVYTAGALTSHVRLGAVEYVFRLTTALAPVFCRWRRHIILWGLIMVIIRGTTSTNWTSSRVISLKLTLFLTSLRKTSPSTP